MGIDSKTIEYIRENPIKALGEFKLRKQKWKENFMDRKQRGEKKFFLDLMHHESRKLSDAIRECFKYIDAAANAKRERAAALSPKGFHIYGGAINSFFGPQFIVEPRYTTGIRVEPEGGRYSALWMRSTTKNMRDRTIGLAGFQTYTKVSFKVALGMGTLRLAEKNNLLFATKSSDPVLVISSSLCDDQPFSDEDVDIYFAKILDQKVYTGGRKNQDKINAEMENKDVLELHMNTINPNLGSRIPVLCLRQGYIAVDRKVVNNETCVTKHWEARVFAASPLKAVSVIRRRRRAKVSDALGLNF